MAGRSAHKVLSENPRTTASSIWVSKEGRTEAAAAAPVRVRSIAGNGQRTRCPPNPLPVVTTHEIRGTQSNSYFRNSSLARSLNLNTMDAQTVDATASRMANNIARPASAEGVLFFTRVPHHEALMVMEVQGVDGYRVIKSPMSEQGRGVQ